MLKKDRQNYILHQLNVHNKVLLGTLCNEIDVSEDTIRRDLHELSEVGKLIKVHGGAVSTSFYHTSKPNNGVYAHYDKKIIARKAAALIKDGMFVLTGGGTTIIELARCLPKGLKATFISGSIPVINEYMHHPSIEVIVIGDKLSKSSKITAGVNAISQLRSLKVDLCLLGINAIDIENGITDNDWEIVQLKQQMIESSKKTICLTISEKIDTVQPLKVCSLSKIGTLITELDAESKILQPYANHGIEIF